MDINQVHIVGRIISDVIIRHPTDSFTVASFKIESIYEYIDGDFKRIWTERHKIEAYNSLAKLIKKTYLEGQRVSCKGFLKTSTWTNKNSNEIVSITVILIQSIEIDNESIDFKNINEPIVVKKTKKPRKSKSVKPKYEYEKSNLEIDETTIVVDPKYMTDDIDF